MVADTRLTRNESTDYYIQDKVPGLTVELLTVEDEADSSEGYIMKNTTTTIYTVKERITCELTKAFLDDLKRCGYNVDDSFINKFCQDSMNGRLAGIGTDKYEFHFDFHQGLINAFHKKGVTISCVNRRGSVRSCFLTIDEFNCYKKFLLRKLDFYKKDLEREAKRVEHEAKKHHKMAERKMMEATMREIAKKAAEDELALFYSKTRNEVVDTSCAGFADDLEGLCDNDDNASRKKNHMFADVADTAENIAASDDYVNGMA